MVALITNLPEFASELADEIRLFIDIRKIESVESILPNGTTIVHKTDRDNPFSHRCMLYEDGILKAEGSCKTEAVSQEDFLLCKKMRKRGAKMSAFLCLKDAFREERPWGALTGIRPTKLYRDSIADLGKEGADRLFQRNFYVSDEKMGLLKRIYAEQKKIIGSVSAEEAGIYIGIPFCRSKCAYCSFSSSLISKDGGKEKAYVDALEAELHMLRDELAGYKIRSVYIGGGTPSALDDTQFARVAEMGASFAAAEYTVEAGRPDTITKEKLTILKDAGVGRISINPQTTKDETLARIGRRHTAAEFFAAAEMAAGFGFDAVNMDLIVGLPGENEEDFKRSLADVMRFNPQNITVHTLAIKRASEFGIANEHAFMPRAETERTVALAGRLLQNAGYEPYYMYRQKYMTGNLENVGYTVPGHACIYNVDIMEELSSIFAFGAGSISKRIFNGRTLRIERAANVKDIALYISRIGEMADRKKRLFNA